MKKHITIFLALVIVSLESCGQENNHNTLTHERIRTKYNFKPISNTKTSEELIDQLYIPFLDDGKYHLVNYEGERITKKSWDEIILVQYNFYWGKIENTFWLYSFPENLVVDHGFTFTISQLLELPYFIKVEKETEDSITFRISIENTKLELLESENHNTSNEVEEAKFSELKIEENYLFSVSNPRSKINKSSRNSPIGYKKTGDKFAIIDTSGNEITKSIFTHRPIIYGPIQWICVQKDDSYGVLDFDNNWIFPLDSRKLKPTYAAGRHLYVFELQEKGYRCKFNERMELIFEHPFVFIKTSDFEWDKVPDDIRPIIDEVQRPRVYQQYYVISGKGYGHIFTAEGKYISSHKGSYDENVSFVGLPRMRKYQYEFVPIGKFKDHDKEYYVRLSDGFEYRK